MADIIEGVHPTRMELLEIKKRAKLAKKGHHMLKEKRDALVMEFFEVVKKAKGTREKLGQLMEEGYSDIIRAQALIGTSQVKSAALGRPESIAVDISLNNIMGVKVPKIAVEKSETEKIEVTPLTSEFVVSAIEKWEEIVEQIMILAEIEETVRRLAEEIKKTKRRVNALEYILLPQLSATQRYIRMRLEEMERENFFRLKTVKKKKFVSS